MIYELGRFGVRIAMNLVLCFADNTAEEPKTAFHDDPARRGDVDVRRWIGVQKEILSFGSHAVSKLMRLHRVDISRCLMKLALLRLVSS